MINIIETEKFTHHVDWYYYFLIKLIKKNIKENINISIGLFHNEDENFISIGVQIEHVIIFNKSENKFFTNIHLFDFLLEKDIIIEYSKPNIKQINNTILDINNYPILLDRTSIENLKKYIQKTVYVAPIIWDFNFSPKKRDYVIFVHEENYRRYEVRKKIENNNIDIKFINNCFEMEKLREIYDFSKILINIHQTDTNHTFEELRVLPALSRGVIIISELSPYIDEIPYWEFIIWSEYDKLCETVLDVIKNYEYYQKKLFNNKLNDILIKIKKDNEFELTNKIKSLKKYHDKNRN
jgi:hypothetical protein